MDIRDSSAVNINDYQKKNSDNATQKSPQNERVHKIHKRRVTALVTILGVVVCFFGLQIGQAQGINNQTNHEISVQKKQYKKQKNINDGLKDRVKELNNPDYLEKVIRSKYSYTKSDEQVYNLPSSND